MGHMKKYKCPDCFSTSFVVKFGYRRKVHRFFCRRCNKHYSVDPYFPNKKGMLTDHLDGLSFRDLSRKYGVSPMSAWRICEDELKKLPDNNQFTFRYCQNFSSIMVVDGKYFNVVNGKNNPDWILLWSFDYFRHDIPVINIVPSESYSSWAKFFSYFRIINHYPELLICDDNVNLKMAAYDKFPGVKIQTCHNHFKENIRRDLKVRSQNTYQPFMERIERILGHKLNDEDMNKKLFALYRDYKHDPIAVSVLTNIQKYRQELLSYRGIPQAPLTTNIIEGMNGHIEQRLVSICSFQSVAYAKLWFNGYILKRRMTKFTDCRGRFRYLNGKTGVSQTKKQGVDIPSYFT